MTTESTRSVEPMTPNTTVENSGYTMKQSPSPGREGLKRKAGEGAVNPEDKENGGSADKKAKVDDASLVELKGRKLIFKQDASSRNLPRRQLLKFEGWLLDEVEAGRTVGEIPEEFWVLIVMAGHELNSSNESLFLKHLKSALDVVKSGQDPLPNESLTPLIPKLFTLHQYGFLPSDFAPSSSTTKVPAALQIRCWEANDLQKHFPSDQLEELLIRRKAREQAREECVKILDGLDDIEKLELIKGDKVDKGSLKEAKEKVVVAKTEEVEESPRIARRKDREGTANTVESRGRSASPTKKGKVTPEEEEAARLKKEEREAKKAEMAEKKAAKEKEKERRDAVVAKQAKAMLGFFKAKAPTTPPISRASEAGPSSSDYSRVFLPMTQRPNVQIAEINRWTPKNRSINGDTSLETKHVDVQDWQPLDFITEHLRKHGKQVRSSRTHLPKGLKSMPPHGSVADVYNTLEDAEDPREVLSQLKDRKRFPWKTLAFDQQTRPPYCGTFTKKSVVVGPRTPFAQDPIFDYSYDSSDDWVDDEGGEDVDDFGDGEVKEDEEDEEDEEDDEDEGEFDDWLDDAEDVEFTPVDGDVDPLGGPEQARLPMKVVKKSRDVPKKVVKLTPSWKGPVWEKTIGDEGVDGLEGYRIQLLNDTPHSINPFTFTSPEPVQSFKSSFSTTVIGTTLNVRCLLSVEPIVAAPAPPTVPEKPIHVPNSSSIYYKPVYPASAPVVVNGDIANGTTQPKSRPAPKVGFPEEHLAELYRLIDGSKKIKPDLISQLRERFENVTTKVAIEAKLREVAVKEGKGKESQWKVKSEAWTAIGLSPPVPTPTPASAPAQAANSKSVADFFSSPAAPSSDIEIKKKSLDATTDEPMIIDA
ncbi:hypothetical protein V866_003860 [Kwoniella sp. B9012]|uniref:Chromatin assembly factor 1 subunit A n=1 Tax=Kwoniella europaea PYCC6329 TaxID=1423913 RepID=A0AAX4KJI2_9TREE